MAEHRHQSFRERDACPECQAAMAQARSPQPDPLTPERIVAVLRERLTRQAVRHGRYGSCWNVRDATIALDILDADLAVERHEAARRTPIPSPDTDLRAALARLDAISRVDPRNAIGEAEFMDALAQSFTALNPGVRPDWKRAVSSSESTETLDAAPERAERLFCFVHGKDAAEHSCEWNQAIPPITPEDEAAMRAWIDWQFTPHNDDDPGPEHPTHIRASAGLCASLLAEIDSLRAALLTDSREQTAAPVEGMRE